MNQHDDPIVSEVRQAGANLFKRFNNDLEAVFKHLQDQTEAAAQQGRIVVGLPPSRVEPRRDVSKRAG
jgi:hypothetical protein